MFQAQLSDNPDSEVAMVLKRAKAPYKKKKNMEEEEKNLQWRKNVAPSDAVSV